MGEYGRNRCRAACVCSGQRLAADRAEESVARFDLPVRGDDAREGLHFSRHIVAQLWVGGGVRDRSACQC